jgi:thiol peroxidase
MHHRRPTSRFAARTASSFVLAAVACVAAGCASSRAVERAGLVTMRGNPIVLVGQPIQVGDEAPDASVVANDMSTQRLSQWRGKVVILATIPSVDTPVCDKETRTFNERVALLGPDVVCLTVSRDLPMAQKRWCGANGIERVVTLSDARDREVGIAYGVEVRETRLLARAVFVIDRDGIVRHEEIVSELATEPDYDAALEVAADLVR